MSEEERKRRQERRPSAFGGAVDTGSDVGCCLAEAASDIVGSIDVPCCLAEASITPDCFVATAALGSPQHPDLDDLRALRDQVLRRTAPGRLFVHCYYHYGRYVARFIAGRPALKLLVRTLIVRPMAALSRRLLRPI